MLLSGIGEYYCSLQLQKKELTVNTTIRDQCFYEEFFGFVPDISTISMSMGYRDFNCPIVRPKGISVNLVWDVCKKRFKCWQYDGFDLESLLRESERGEMKETSVRFFRTCVEADEETKNRSVNDIARLRGITLLERLIMELKYFSETGEHLDIESWTLCSGSRFSDGSVPCVFYAPPSGSVGVCARDANDRNDHLRARGTIW